MEFKLANSAIFDKELIGRYNLNGPRYTSYPSAIQFHEDFGIDEYFSVANCSNEDFIPKPLSLYIHLPFCNTVCYYCACNKIVTANHQRAVPYLKDLHKEIQLQSKLFDNDRIVKQMHWGGGTPTFISHEQMRELVQILKDNFNFLNDDSGEYSIEIDPREVDTDTVFLLRKLGFNRMSIGVQDFNLEVQQAVNRNQSYEQTEFVVNEARKHGFLSINFDLIYGLPKQSVNSFKETIDKVLEIEPDRLAIYNYAHLPHLFKTQRQIKNDELPSANEKLEILDEAIHALTQAGYVYIGMDHFAKPDDELAVAQRNGKLYRNFQGYSTNADCDVVGLGVTAISKIRNSYSQNYRSLDEYHQAIEQQHIPVFRGYLLERDDELRRDIISQLICHFEVSFDEIEDIYNIKFLEYFEDELNQLDEIKQDKLIDISEDKIEVLLAGRFFIRNICSVFDRYNQTGKPTNQYSKMI